MILKSVFFYSLLDVLISKTPEIKTRVPIISVLDTTSPRKIFARYNVDTGPKELMIAVFWEPILMIPCDNKNTGITVENIAIEKLNI